MAINRADAVSSHLQAHADSARPDARSPEAREAAAEARRRHAKGANVAQPPHGFGPHKGGISPEDRVKAAHAGMFAASVGRKHNTNTYSSPELRESWSAGHQHYKQDP